MKRVKLSIHNELARDAPAIRRVNEAAFGQREEADIVEALRKARAISCSLVATQDNAVVGHILFSPVAIETDHRRLKAIGLAPMAVVPDQQRTGIGGALIRTGLEQLRGAGHSAVVVLGHPSYYPRFGFRPARELGLRWEHGHEEAFMALELIPKALEGVSGVVRYRPEVMGFRIRRAELDELAHVQAIEMAASARFRQSTHPHAADLPSLTTEYLVRLLKDDGVWIVTAPGGAYAAFAAFESIGLDLYVVEVDVIPAHAGARLGAALLDHATLIAQHRRLERVVLRTFTDVPWNAPYYRRLGFVEPDSVSPLIDLNAVIVREVANNIDLSRRVTLTRSVR